VTHRVRCLITAGPTREHLDPVRFLSNGSSGRMGYALAAAAVRRGWKVDLVSGPVDLPAPEGAAVHRVVSAAEMFAACARRFAACDLFFAVAAVADYRPKHRVPRKGRKRPGLWRLELVPTIDILQTLAARKRPDQVVVGFAAETHALLASAQRKLAAKRLDWIVANDVSRPGLGMGAARNAVVLLAPGRRARRFGPAPKAAVAEFILRHVAAKGST